jgi:type II secretory pathway pseudopilin PulG
MMHSFSKKFSGGLILVNVIIFVGISITVVAALTTWGAAVLRSTQTLAAREQALQIAEAGIEYYRWHLAHAPLDYKDGTGGPGPYVHQVRDTNGVVVGEYSLEITPPPLGSTHITLRSTGTASSSPGISRTIEAEMAIPSFTGFAVVANEELYFSQGTEIFGPVHSNGGIRFDGIAHNLVTSAKSEYNDLSVPGGMEFGVYTMVAPADPHPPAAVPPRPDVFMAGRTFPVPAVDFGGLTHDLAQLKAAAQSGGRYIPSSGKQGYHVKLKTNDTFDLYKVNSLTPPGNSKCKDNQNQGGWGTWSIQNEQFVANYPFPDNGIIFLEDHLWIDGTIDGARLTVAVGRFPEAPGQYRHVVINTDVRYTNYDGTDVLGIVSQGDIDIGLESNNVLRIDAALVAQNGRAARYYYSDDCGVGHQRDTLTLFGMIASHGRFGFAYTDGTGYTTRNIIYDINLLFNPPPGFPLTSNQYEMISWREVN